MKVELEKAGAANAFVSKVKEEFSKLLSQASGSRSIAHIHEAKAAAEQAYDRALTEMEKAVIEPEPEVVPETGGGAVVAVVTPKPKLKMRRWVEPKALWKSEFIETADDMEAFLNALRQELQATLDDGERAQLK